MFRRLNFTVLLAAAMAAMAGCTTGGTRSVTRLPPPPAVRPANPRPNPPAIARVLSAPAPARPTPSIWRTEASRWIGTPYREGGNGKDGVDCSGFVTQVYRSVASKALPRTTREQFQTGEPVRHAALQPGDLVFFETTRPPVSHVGIWLGENQFVHASTSRGVIISLLTEPYYWSRFRGARRIIR